MKIIMLRKVFQLSVGCFIWSFPIIFFNSTSARSQQDNSCYMKSSSGQTIILDKFCNQGRESKMEEEISDELDPNYVTSLKGGGWKIKLGAPKAFRLPTGEIYYPDGRIKSPEGLTYKYVVKDGKVVGEQFYKDTGELVKPGEIITLPSGETIQQKMF
jgi:hypothetical protein